MIDFVVESMFLFHWLFIENFDWKEEKKVSENKHGIEMAVVLKSF